MEGEKTKLAGSILSLVMAIITVRYRERSVDTPGRYHGRLLNASQNEIYPPFEHLYSVCPRTASGLEDYR